MTALLRSELLKLRTTRSSVAYPLALAVLAGLGAAGRIGSAPDDVLNGPRFLAEVVGDASISSLIALIVGIVAVTNEFRHGTITPTLLVFPLRDRLVAVKTVAATLYGVGLAAVGLAAVVSVAAVWLTAEGAPRDFASTEVWRTIGGVVAGAAVAGALGAAIGAAVHTQVGALVGSIVWLLLGETLLTALLPAIEVEGVGDYLPGQVLNSLNDPVGTRDALAFWPALAVALAYVLAIGLVGVVRTERRDIT